MRLGVFWMCAVWRTKTLSRDGKRDVEYERVRSEKERER